MKRFLALLTALALASAPAAWAADVKPLVNASGAVRPMHTGETVGVPMGGAGAVSFRAHCVLIAEGVGAFHIACPSSAGLVLTDNGGSSDPTFQAAPSTAPGGTSGQVQYNNSSVFGGFTVGGDGTLNTATGALSVTKTGGVSFGYFATGLDAANLTGTLACARHPALTGDTTTSAGSCATTTSQAAKWTTARTLSFTGDVTGSGSVDGSAGVATALTIANDAVTTVKILGANVTLAKIANAAASSKLLGSGASGSGASYAELSLGKNLSMVSTTLNVVPRVSSATSVASPLAWNSDNFDQYAYTALANALTINADAGTPVDGQKIIFRIKDSGTARALTWTTGSSKAFRAVGVTLPTTTVISKVVYVGAIYNADADRWDVIAVVQEV